MKKIIPILMILGCLGLSAPTLFKSVDKDVRYSWSDAEGYYMYLPAFFIYDGFTNYPIQTPQQFDRVESTGKVYNKYTFGVAILQTPLFLLSHAYFQLANGQAPQGFSYPYQLAILFSALLCVGLGLRIVYGELKRNHYSTLISTMVVSAMFFGTNLMHYTFAEPGMSHAYSFFLVALLIPTTKKFYESAGYKSALYLPLLIGLIVFIRPTNLVFAILILFFGCNIPGHFAKRVQFIGKNLGLYILLPIPFLLFFSVQIGIWSNSAGELTLYSYRAEPGFIYWARPKILQVLFGVQNGLLLYSPVLVFGFCGLVWGAITRKQNYRTILTMFALASYIFASWWAYWFGGAFGHRAYIEFLPLLALPLADCIRRAFLSRWPVVRYAFCVVFAIAIFYSIRMTELYVPPWDGEGWNWNVYGEFVKKAFFLI